MKNSERSILRVKDIKEQGESRYALLPGGLDRVIIAFEYYEVIDEILMVYGPKGTQSGPLFSCPVANGFVIIDRKLVDLETVEAGIRRHHADELAAEALAKELLGEHGKKGPKGGDNVRHLHGLGEPDFDPQAPTTGQYL